MLPKESTFIKIKNVYDALLNAIEVTYLRGKFNILHRKNAVFAMQN